MSAEEQQPEPTPQPESSNAAATQPALLQEPFISNITLTHDAFLESQRRIRLMIKTDKPDAVDRINIVYVGPPGAGKSSTVNATTSALRGRVKQCAEAGTGTSSLTLNFRKHELAPDIAINQHDCRGWEPGAYETGEWNYILDGNVKSGASLASSITPESHLFRKDPQRGDKMHAICFVVPAANSRSAENIEQIKKIAKLARLRHIRMTALISHVDEYDTALANGGLVNLLKSDALRLVREDFAVDSGLPLSSVFFTRNMFGLDVNPVVAALAWRGLEINVGAALDTLEDWFSADQE